MMLTVDEWKRLSSRIVEGPNGCWISNWSLRKKNGYTQFWLRGKQTFVHIVIYEYLRGLIPEGLELDHLCRIKCCVNPAHLEPVPRLENVRRSNADYKKYITHCTKGHEYTKENTSIYVDKAGYSHRYCNECNRLASKARYYKSLNWVQELLGDSNEVVD